MEKKTWSVDTVADSFDLGDGKVHNRCAVDVITWFIVRYCKPPAVETCLYHHQTSLQPKTCFLSPPAARQGRSSIALIKLIATKGLYKPRLLCSNPLPFHHLLTIFFKHPYQLPRAIYSLTPQVHR